MRRPLLALLALLVCASSLTISQPGPGRAARPFKKHENLKALLNLTAEQEARISTIRLQFQKDQLAVHAKIQAARLDLRQLFLADKLDRAAIEKNMSLISDLQHQAKLIHLDHLFAVNDLLTPEQQKIWREHMGERGDRMRGEMHRMRGHMRMMRGELPPMMEEDREDPQ